MKQCPLCHAITEENYECHVCGTTITYEPPCFAEREKLAWNRYTAQYLLRETWLSLLSILVVAGVTVYVWPPESLLRPSLNVFLGAAILCAAASLVLSLLDRHIVRWVDEWSFTKKYTDEYIRARNAVKKILLAVAAIVLALITVGLNHFLSSLITSLIK